MNATTASDSGAEERTVEGHVKTLEQGEGLPARVPGSCSSGGCNSSGAAPVLATVMAMGLL